MYLHQGLEDLHKSQFPSVFCSEEETRQKLIDAQLLLASNPSNVELCQKVQQARDEMLYWSKAALSYMVQKSKEDWLLKGDRNTQYFHAVMRKKAYRNTIYSLQNAQGDVLT